MVPVGDSVWIRGSQLPSRSVNSGGWRAGCTLRGRPPRPGSHAAPRDPEGHTAHPAFPAPLRGPPRPCPQPLPRRHLCAGCTEPAGRPAPGCRRLSTPWFRGCSVCPPVACGVAGPCHHGTCEQMPLDEGGDAGFVTQTPSGDVRVERPSEGRATPPPAGLPLRAESPAALRPRAGRSCFARVATCVSCFQGPEPPPPSGNVAPPGTGPRPSHSPPPSRSCTKVAFILLSVIIAGFLSN